MNSPPRAMVGVSDRRSSRALGDQVVEVHHVAAREPRGVRTEQPHVVGGQLVVVSAVAAEPVQQRPAMTLRHAEPPQDELLVEFVRHPEPLTQTHSLSVLAQQCKTERVDRAAGDRLGAVAQRVFQPNAISSAVGGVTAQMRSGRKPRQTR